MTRTSILSGVKQKRSTFLVGGTTAPCTTNDTIYLAMNGSQGVVGADGSRTQLVPCKGTFSNLRVTIKTAAGAGESYIFTLRVNGVNSALTCTVSGATATTASDKTHKVAVAEHDNIDLLLVTSAAAAADYAWFSLEFQER